MASPVLQIIETQELGASPAQLYISDAVSTQIMALNCVNTDVGTHQVTIYLVPEGSAAGTSTISTQARAILAGSNYNGANEYGQVLNPGDSIWAFADTGGKVNIMASGLVTTS
jgi:hypothetical protein